MITPQNLMQLTQIDYLAFRTKASVSLVLRSLLWMFDDTSLTTAEQDRGRDGFADRISVRQGGVNVALILRDGKSQRGWTLVVLPGEGCRRVKRWALSDEVAEDVQPEVRRLDVCLDVCDGRMTHSLVHAAYDRGEFRGRGRSPKLRDEGTEQQGKTLYVGGRKKTEKMFRGYEKDKQVECLRRKGRYHGPEVPIGTYRMEVEFKAQKRSFPWQWLRDRDAAFVGAYGFCARTYGEVASSHMDRPTEIPLKEASGAPKNWRKAA